VGILEVAFVLCASIAGAAIASVPRGASLVPMALAALFSAVLALRLARRSAREPASLVDRLSAPLCLAFLVPVLTMPVAPGADMAMHAALARALAEGSSVLSPAWGQVSAALYPRGFSAVIALVSPLLGLAKGSLFASGLSYLVVAAGAAAFYRYALEVPHPIALSTVTVLACDVPQRFFSWGGNPNAMAFGLALFAAALLARAWREREAAWSHALAATMLALGALAVHPTGAVAGLSTIAVLPVRAWLRRERPDPVALISSLVALGLMASWMIALKIGGPELSEGERSWIASYQGGVEHVLHGSDALFALTIWEALPRVLGWSWIPACGVAAAVLLLSREGRVRVACTVAAVLAIGALFVVGPHLPGIGVVIYPGRFSPLLALATAPLLAWAVEAMGQRWRNFEYAAWIALVALGLARNVKQYQRELPMATFGDLDAIACVEKSVPAGEVIDGAYGDATQWIPALTGRTVVNAQAHISLNDEFQAYALLRPQPGWLFVGERLRYGEPADTRPPASEPVCRSGNAALYVLASH
jgi:hypothetical protein